MKISVEKLKRTLQPAQLYPWLYTQRAPVHNVDTGTSVLTASVFTITGKRKQPRCLSIEKRINRIHYTHKVKLYVVVRKNEITAFVEKWVELEISVLLEIGQTQGK